MKEQATLLETSTAVISSLEPDIVLHRIPRANGTAIENSNVCHHCPGRPGRSIPDSRGRGLSQQFTERLSIMPSEPDSVTMRALHSGEPIQVSDTETVPSYKIGGSTARAEGYRAILAVPLHTNHAPPDCSPRFSPESARFH